MLPKVAKQFILIFISAIFAIGLGLWLIRPPADISQALNPELWGADATEPSPVALINGEPVMPYEYFVFLHEQVRFFEQTGGADIWEVSFGNTPAQMQAKLNALRQLSLVRTVSAQAAALGVDLPPSAYAAAEQAAATYLAQIPPELAERTGSNFGAILPTMLQRQMLEYMYERVTANFTVSPADFEVFFEAYILSSTNYVRISSTVAHAPQGEYPLGEQAAELAAEILRSGHESQLPPSLASIISISQAQDLAASTYPAALALEARRIEIGDVFVYSAASGHYVVRVDGRSIPDVDTLASSALEQYTKIRRDEIFNQQYENWRGNEPIIILNDEVFTSISINDFEPI